MYLMGHQYVVDLEALATELVNIEGLTRLGAKIRTLMVTQSCLADLRLAQSNLTALTELAARPDALSAASRETIIRSLIADCLMLYGRALAPMGQRGARPEIKIHAKLTDPQDKADHDFLLSLRHRAIAHAYPGEEIEGHIWTSSSLCVAPDPDSRCWTPIITTRTTSRNPAVITTLRRMLPKAIEILASLTNLRLDEVTMMLNSAGSPVVEPMRRCARLAAEFFGSEETAKGILAARTPGGEATIFSLKCPGE